MLTTYTFSAELKPYDNANIAYTKNVFGTFAVDISKYLYYNVINDLGSVDVTIVCNNKSVNYTTGQIVDIARGFSPIFIGTLEITFGSDLSHLNFREFGTEGTTFYANDILACFCAGALIATPEGPRPVETLRIGDRVLTAEGGVETLRWSGRRAVHTRFADPLRAWPVRIDAGALGDALPTQDLRLSPDHALYLDGVLVQAGALVNGRTIVQQRPEAETFTYYHLEIDSHALILANGAPAETFVDTVTRMGFDNWAEHEALYPGGRSVAELPFPRAKSARQVPRALRRRLDARAEALTPQAA